MATTQNLHEGYANLESSLFESSNSEVYSVFNGHDHYCICVYLMPNFISSGDRFKAQSGTRLRWGNDVTNITIHDSLFSFGIYGSMELVTNKIELIYRLSQSMDYDLVINIIHKLDDTGRRLRFEPYILSVVSVTEIASSMNGAKRLLVNFEDVLTTEAKRHSYGTLIKLFPNIKQAKSFPELFEMIYNYLSDIVFWTNNKKIKYNQKIKFNTYTGGDENSIMEIVFDSLKPDQSIYDLIVEMAKVACVEITPDSNAIQGLDMSLGNILIPLFFKQEYPDVENFYYKVHGEEAEDFSARGGSNEHYVPRPFTLRNFYTPFSYAFNPTQPVIYEAFSNNQQAVVNDNLAAINGNTIHPVHHIETLLANTDTVTKRWKNIWFMKASASENSKLIIYFNWIYHFFNQVFLSSKLDSQDIRLSNVVPNFYLASAATSDLFEGEDDDFTYANTNVIMIKNEKANPLKEVVMEIGKSIASLVFLNNLTSFEVEGNLFRRPNEVIALYTSDITEKGGSMLSRKEVTQNMYTDLSLHNNVMLYVTEVIHIFNKTTFIDKIVCNRIYEHVKQVTSES